jgi:hypothetical protein
VLVATDQTDGMIHIFRWDGAGVHHTESVAVGSRPFGLDLKQNGDGTVTAYSACETESKYVSLRIDEATGTVTPGGFHAHPIPDDVQSPVHVLVLPDGRIAVSSPTDRVIISFTPETD